MAGEIPYLDDEFLKDLKQMKMKAKILDLAKAEKENPETAHIYRNQWGNSVSDEDALARTVVRETYARHHPYGITETNYDTGKFSADSWTDPDMELYKKDAVLNENERIKQKAYDSLIKKYQNPDALEAVYKKYYYGNPN